MYFIDQETVGFAAICLIIIIALIALVIWSFAYNRTTVKNHKEENKLLKQEIKALKQYDAECRKQFDYFNTRIKVLESEIKSLKK